MKIDLPWFDRSLSPNSRVHWRTQAKIKKLAKEIGFMEARKVYKPGEDIPYTGNLRVTYHAYPHDGRAANTDDDNLIAAMKAYRDGVALALAVNDKQFETQPVVWHERYPGGKIIMEIEEI